MYRCLLALLCKPVVQGGLVQGMCGPQMAAAAFAVMLALEHTDKSK
jgi:hypothetical protein